MADPPPYEESNSGKWQARDGAASDSKGPQRLSIREEVGASRSRHIEGVTSQLLPLIEQRARRGLARSNLLLLPSKQQNDSSKGQLVGYPENELPILVNLEGNQDTVEFWAQAEVLELLRAQMLDALSEGSSFGMQPTVVAALQEPVKARKTSFWGRKSSVQPDVIQNLTQPKSPITVDVQFDEAHFRTETDFGLYQTIRERCISLTVEVR